VELGWTKEEGKEGGRWAGSAGEERGRKGPKWEIGQRTRERPRVRILLEEKIREG
jgi:hypothetical protein